MRLILSRARAARTLLTAAGLAAAVTTGLLVAFALYAQLLPNAGLRGAIEQAAPIERSVVAAASAGRSATELADRDAVVRELLGGGLTAGDAEVYAGGYASGQELPEGFAPEEGSAVVGFLTGLELHAELVSGDWPEPAAAGEPVPAVLPAQAATALGVAVGDQLPITDRRASDEVPAPLLVVGVWEPVDPDDPYWQLLSAPVERGGWGPFLVHPAEFTDRYQLLGTLEWLVAPEPATLAEGGMTRLREDYLALVERVSERRDTDPALDSSLRLRSDLDELADRLATATVVNRSGMVLPAALVAVIAGYGLVLVARLLASHRRGENALLRARGASRRQLVRLTAAEAALVVAPAALLGAPLGTALVGLVDRRAADQTFLIGADLAPYGLLGPPLAWVVALAAAAGCAAALALPTAGRGRTWVAEQQELSRPSRLATAQRAGTDLALVVLAILAWLQLRRYGTAVSPTDAGLGIDPLLVAAPVVAVVAATAVALRLLPLATRLGVRLAQRRDAFAGLLGMWQADRRPHAGPVLLLVLAVATAVLAPAVASTWQQSQRDQAAQAVGADLRVPVTNPAIATGSELQAMAPAGSGLMPVHRGRLTLPDVGQTTLLAIDTEQATEVAKLRSDLVAGRPEALFDRLRDGRPELTGVPLPERAERLTGRFTFDVPEPAVVTFQELRFVPPENQREEFEVTEPLPTPVPDRLALHFLDAEGIVHTNQVGRRVVGEFGQLAGGIVLDDDGGLELDIELPEHAVALVGLSGGYTIGGFRAFLTPLEELPPVPVRWGWERLQVVDADGAASPVELPPDWQLSTRELGPEATWDAAAAAGEFTLLPERDFPSSGRYTLLAPPPPRSAMPVAVTADLMAASGSEVGRIINLSAGVAGTLPAMQVVEVVDAVPGTATGSGVLMDLNWLATQQFLAERQQPVVNEWWVTGAADSVPALEQLSWTGQVEVRQAREQALLDDPLGTGVLLALWAAAGAAGLLAAFGLVVDSRATAVRRRRELAVLHTLGTPPASLARALVVEQAVLAGLGVAAGLAVGVAVAAAMGPSLILTEAGAVPVPAPLLTLVPAQLVAPMLGLLVVAVGLGALVARRARREVAAGALRIGEE